jgi:hypothetical protein
MNTEEKHKTLLRIKKNKNNPYVMINKKAMSNINLSWKAKGILAYLLSLPDDWILYISELSKHATNGKSSLYSGIKELSTNGYISKKTIRNKKGQIKNHEYTVHEKPLTSLLHIENLDVVNLHVENSPLLNKDNTKKEIKQNNNLNVAKKSNRDNFNLKDTSTITFYNKCANKLIKELTIKNKIMRNPNNKKWTEEFIKLKTKDQVSKSDIKKVLIYYLKNIGQKYIPDIRSARTFRLRFDDIYKSMQRDNKQSKDVDIKITAVAKKIAKRLSNLNFPKGSQSQLLVTIQLSLNNYSKYYQKHYQLQETSLYNNMSKAKQQALTRIIKLLDSHLLPEQQFVRQWMEKVHSNILNWDNWNGNLISTAFDSDGEKFQKLGRQWVTAYCNNSSRWYNYYKLLE